MMPPVRILARAAVVGLALTGWFLTQRLLARRTPPGAGLGDRLHDWSGPWNAWLGTHPRAANALLVASSAFIDLFGLGLIGLALFGPTFTPFVSLLILFSLRQACQATISLPAPPGSIWRYPGFPSLLVTYNTDGDYFFSGHTAVAVLGAIELGQVGPSPLAAAAWIIAGLEAATVLVLRAHYSMDVLCAALAAWCAHAFGALAGPAVDAWLAFPG